MTDEDDKSWRIVHNKRELLKAMKKMFPPCPSLDREIADDDNQPSEGYCSYVEHKRDPLVVAYDEEMKKKMAPFYEAEKRYLATGLGGSMRQFWNYAPPEAMEYPGGPIAVYEEAIRRGITWQEVCGYKKRDYSHFKE